MSKNDGGPAFPSAGGMAEIVSRMSQSDNGMSLRDYFAAAVLPSLLDKHSYVHVAGHAYTIADAMLVERSKSKGAP